MVCQSPVKNKKVNKFLSAIHLGHMCFFFVYYGYVIHTYIYIHVHTLNIIHSVVLYWVAQLHVHMTYTGKNIEIFLTCIEKEMSKKLYSVEQNFLDFQKCVREILPYIANFLM